MNIKPLLLSMALAITSFSSEASVVIFDNFKGTGADNYVEETRSADLTFGTVLNSLSTTTIEQLGVRWRPDNDMDITFLIFDSELEGTFGSLNWSSIGNNLLFSQTKHFTAQAGAVGYIYSDAFSFTFQANHRYDIGILGSTGTLTGSWDIQNGSGSINTIMGGFESINRNANLVPTNSNFGYAGVDPHIQLIADVAQIPEPATLALIGLGLAGMGFRRNSRNSAA